VNKSLRIDYWGGAINYNWLPLDDSTNLEHRLGI
jgi:hypothetical protein